MKELQIRDGRERSASPPVWTVTRPDGTVWQRTFASAQAAWRVLTPGLTGAKARVRRAEMRAEGWMVDRRWTSETAA